MAPLSQASGGRVGEGLFGESKQEQPRHKGSLVLRKQKQSFGESLFNWFDNVSFIVSVDCVKVFPCNQGSKMIQGSKSSWGNMIIAGMGRTMDRLGRVHGSDLFISHCLTLYPLHGQTSQPYAGCTQRDNYQSLHDRLLVSCNTASGVILVYCLRSKASFASLCNHACWCSGDARWNRKTLLSTPPGTNMEVDNVPLEDHFPPQTGGFPLPC